MVENDFTTLAHKIIDQWRNENVPLNTGATEDELLAFEKRFALTLPPDLRYFYSLVNGMPKYEADRYLFNLWPLERITAEVEGGVAFFEKRDEKVSEDYRENSECSTMFGLFHFFTVPQKKSRSVERIKQPFAFGRIEIPFGDVLIDSYRYLLYQDKEERFFVSFAGIERLADNFSHFLYRYLTEPEKIYLLI